MRQMTKDTPAPSVDVLLKALRDAGGNLVSSRELKERFGPKWRDTLALVRKSYTVDETVGNGGSRSYRLNEDKPPPKYLTEPAPPPVPMSRHLHGRTAKITLTAEDIRALLRGQVPPTARDALVGGLMMLTEENS